MTDLKPLAVGEPGRQYVRTLMERTPGLCAALMSAVASGGECYAIVAEGLPLEKALQFEGSPGNVDCSSRDWLAQRVANWLKMAEAAF